MPPLVAGALDAVVCWVVCDAGRDSMIGARDGAGRDDAREAAVGALEIDGVRRAGAVGLDWAELALSRDELALVEGSAEAGAEGVITPSDSVTGTGAPGAEVALGAPGALDAPDALDASAG